MSVSSIPQASPSLLYLQKVGQNTQQVAHAADNDGDSDDVAGASGIDTDRDGGSHRVNIKA